jgi:Fe-S-cluster containining protein
MLRGERFADVPCGDCVACCVSSYPIPLRSSDELARERVPEQWLIGAAEPGEQWLMGFRQDGSCPFLEQRCCSIYAARPQTCRDYDCRIYAAAGLTPDGDRQAIAQRVQAWEFDFASEQERQDADAVRRAAQFIRTHAAWLPPAMRAASATAAAVLAIKTFALFVRASHTPDSRGDPIQQVVQRVVDAARAFDQGTG